MRLQITHFDTAMVRLDIGPFRLLTDPVLDPAGGTYRHRSFELVKTGESGSVNLEEAIGSIDAVLLSHAQHSDNLDRRGRSLIHKLPRIFTTTSSARQLQRDASSATHIVGMQPWDSHLLQHPNGAQIRITAVPARHGPSWMLPDLLPSIGKVTGFILEWDGQRNGALYVSGDTVPFGGLKRIAKRFPRIGVALLHLGAAKFPVTGSLRFSLDAKAALKVSDWLQPHTIIPIHYDGWNHFSQTPQQVQSEFARTSQAVQLRWLDKGIPTAIDI